MQTVDRYHLQMSLEFQILQQGDYCVGGCAVKLLDLRVSREIIYHYQVIGTIEVEEVSCHFLPGVLW